MNAMRSRLAVALTLGGILLAGPAAVGANTPTAPASAPIEFETEAQAQRYQVLVRELRCTVCQHQNLIESNAPLAADLRRQISLMVRDGAEKEEVIDYMVSRYGDFVRFQPPMNASTYLLWFGPGLLLAGGFSALGIALWRRRRQVRPDALSPEEEARLQKLLNRTKDKEKQ
ncbi:cytochrome c-type biogenesis protein [Thioalkalivibrio sp. ALJT]|uniref:cytochrome c-type biogenesis protein n=1 Tax=Thioalkalivibrio sp. ALJT TaxID=1158146 RepID=UPI00036FE3CE|nr:cytochrome c-type biogenesis protein [Thioalkalivibrio sp. ALJT]